MFVAQAVLPPVFVMNPYYTGIGIARNLHGFGVKVYGLSSEKDAPGMKSRFFSGIYEVPDGRDEPEALCQRLRKLREKHGQTPVIFPTRDFDILFLHEFRKTLTPFYLLPQQEGNAIPRLLDKFETATIAKYCHIPVPKTVLCSSLQDIDEQMDSLEFPVVTKPRFAYQWRQKGAWEKVGARKAVIVESVDQLRDEYRKLASVTEEVLVQEYVSGVDSDIVVCCCYINKEGELLGYYTAKKLRQNPPLFGTGCVVEVGNIPEILSPSVQLLQACEYAGLAEIEYKYDKSTNRFFLIEVNPRHWDQHELGNSVGVNLTRIAYLDIIGCDSIPQTPSYKASTKCKWIAERELFLLLMRNAYLEIADFGKSERCTSGQMIVKTLGVFKKTLRELFYLLSGQKVFAILHLDDPLPGVLMCLRFFLEFSKILDTHIWKMFLKLRKVADRRN